MIAALYRTLYMTMIFGAFAVHAKGIDLRSGDILLQPLNCWSCSLIEAQEKTIYSHIGVYLELESGSFVLEALGRVKLTPMNEFLQRAEEGQSVRVMRFINKRFDSEALLKSSGKFLGLSYDKAFLWDNFDEFGEKIYCSELVYKVFEPFYGSALPLKRMSFDVNPKLWERYFDGDVPEGLWGNSPEDFHRSELLEIVGEL